MLDALRKVPSPPTTTTNCEFPTSAGSKSSTVNNSVSQPLAEKAFESSLTISMHLSVGLYINAILENIPIHDQTYVETSNIDFNSAPGGWVG